MSVAVYSETMLVISPGLKIDHPRSTSYPKNALRFASTGGHADEAPDWDNLQESSASSSSSRVLGGASEGWLPLDPTRYEGLQTWGCRKCVDGLNSEWGGTTVTCWC